MKRAKHNTIPSKSILTNDPSLTAWGWAIIGWDGNVCASGCIKTKPENKVKRIRKGDDNVRRVAEINNELIRIIKKYNVMYILTELPHGSQNAAAATMIGVVIGIMQTISSTLNIGIEWYSEGDAKKAVLGKQSSTKTEMVNAIGKLFPDAPMPKSGYAKEAVSDALAIYHVAKLQSNAIQLFTKDGQ